MGGELKETNSESDAYKTVGFLDDPLGYPSYAVQFDSYTGPSGSSSLSRSAGMFANFNYSWDNRYLIDLTGRIDGSSNLRVNNAQRLSGRPEFVGIFIMRNL